MNDIFGSITAFQSASSAPRKARGDVEPHVPDRIMNMTDSLQLVNAFQGLPYSFLRCNPNTKRCAGGPNSGAMCESDSECELDPCP